MEVKEAIKRLKELKDPVSFTDCVALEMGVEALKKQDPMEHHHTIVGECSGGEKVRTSICPNCLGCIMTVEEEYPRFCDWCGQAIDWGK